jgi:hypothetical protein
MTTKANSFHVTCIEENEDGSATIQIEVESEQMKKHIFEEGINFLLLKGAIGGTTEDILRWAERGKLEENTDRILKDFSEIYNEDTK